MISRCSILISSLILLSFLSGCSDTGRTESDGSTTLKEKPNIIFILVDDMGWGDVGAFYQLKRKKAGDRSKPWQSTPQLDSLAKDGAMLTNHYASAPVCAPSRASLLTGVSQGHANVRDNQFDKAIEDNHTLASVMKQAGYATAAFGKWGLQGNDKYSKNGGQWPARPRKRGFDYFLGYMRHRDGHEHYPKEAVYSKKSKQVWKNDSVITEKLDKSYTADLWTASAKKWIVDHEKGKKSDHPFFIYLAYDTPHAVLELPTQAYPKGGGLEGGLQWVGTPGQMINTASGKVDSWVHPDYADATYDDDNDPSTPEVPWPEVYKRYATSVRRIDSGVGDIRKLLEDLGINKNTIIVFSSDNGPSRESYLPQRYKPTFFDSYGPFDGIKRDTWEGGIREPTFAVWPGHIAAGKVIDSPSIQYDWLPTFTNAAGFPAPANTDGVSLLPTLTGRGKQQKSSIYVEYYHRGVTPDYEAFAPRRRDVRRKQMQMLRLGDYVGVRYNIQKSSDDFEIYNVKKDPGQRNNLAQNPEHPPLIDELQRKMKHKVLQMRIPNDSAPRPYDAALIPALDESNMQHGLLWKSYHGKFLWPPKVAGLTATDSGSTDRPSVSVIDSSAQALYFEGYLQAPKDGLYTLSLSADKAGVLRLHDITVIDADYGYQSGTERSGTVKLKAGLHPLRLYYLKGAKSNPSLQLKWSGPDISKQSIPDSAFFRSSL